MNKIFQILLLVGFSFFFLACESRKGMDDLDVQIDELLKRMTIEEKIGQLVQKNGDHPNLEELIEAGKIGSVLNQVDPEAVNKIQQIAVEESRLGIPLLIGRDVIHGFRTIMPIPLAQAASWNVNLVEQAARVAAIEASSQGVRWSFAPMIDVTRDPRWGRIAESFGEDHLLNGIFGAAVIRGFQGDDLSNPTSIAACVKHFAAYGWAEGGRDYNTANISENDLYDIVLPPFKMCIDAGAASIMTAFNEINGIPATGHVPLLRNLLRKQWGYNGVVLSDWESVTQMVVHGYTPNHKESAVKAIQATVDMEMASTAYETYLSDLIKEGRISEKQIDDAVRRILQFKFKLGLFENPYAHMGDFPELLNDDHLHVAKKLAQESVVLLKNEGTLPISNQVKRIAVIGPLADAPHDQLGTWIFDGRKEDAITPLQSLKEVGKYKGIEIFYHRALELSRSKNIIDRQSILRDVKRSDLVLMFLGEESILSGESHCLANIDLQGAQIELAEVVVTAGKPVVAIIMAGRPVTFEVVEPLMDAILYAWHPGTMAGPAIADLLFGVVSPSGKLPVTFPRHVGQIPIYYNHKNTGKPASNETWERLCDIPAEAPQLSIGNTSHYLDYGFEPMYHFGFGLSYSTFEIYDVKLDAANLRVGEMLKVSAKLKNTGKYEASEVVQLYTRQLFGSRTRPVKELRAFEKILLAPSETKEVVFQLNTKSLGFHNPDMKYVVEPGKYNLWVGNSSQSGAKLEFEIIEKQ
jgi:beta-glucosidase